MKITVLGIGNILLRDEGVGVRVVELLKDSDLPEEVELVDGGTATLNLFPILAETEHLIVIDAVKGGMPQGTLYRLKPKDLKPTEGSAVSLHDLGLLQALDMAKAIGKMPKSVMIFGVEPKKIDWGMELSPEIEQELPHLATVIIEEIESLS